MAREDNIRVFEDTEAWCRTNRKIAESLKASQAAQELILETDALPDLDKNRYEKPAKVVVSKKRTLEAARGYAGQKVAVHNFASATNPGGGVTTGAGAQEECICRCSTLYFCLKTQEMQNRFYTPHRQAQNPIHNDDIIYTPEVLVFKTDTAVPRRMDEAEWYAVDVITCAAPNLRAKPSNRYNSGDGNRAVSVKSRELMAIHDKRLRRMLDTALAKGAETVILGAFGCGAFENNPEVVAMATKNVLKDYLHAFCNLEFAVYCTPRDENNYRVFERVLRGVLQSIEKLEENWGMGIYAKILQDSITGIYRTNAANKILQFINRIRNESDVNQARRFLIELMQNARDLAYKKPDGTPEPVSIRIRLSDTELEFSHNGKVFSVKDILSIIYQVSSKKPGEGIGQFGTGFMSTYQLSERVELTSYLKNDDNPYLPFTVCLDRSGLNKEEILDAIERAMAQLMAADQAEGIPDEEFDLTGYNTSFLYHLDQERSREIARIGMEDLDHTILYTLLFSPQIRAVELIYETDFRRERIVYTNGTPVELGNGLYSMEFLQGDRTRHLVYQSAGEGAERITVACEYSDGQILPIGEQTPKLYIDFPLIGAEQFPFPTVINCRALCPNEPRSGISLVDNPNSHDALRNKELMKQAVVLYGQFLHNLVEQDFGSLQNAVAMPVCPENKEWSAQWVHARLYNGCLGCMKREPIFPTRIGKRSLAEGKLCLIRERNEEQRKAVQELAEPFKDLLVPVDDTDWDLALVGYELEKDKWISLERLLQNAEHNAKYRLDTARQDVLSWVGRLYRAAMEAPVLANEIMAGTHPVFLDQEYGRSEQFTLKRFFEVKVDPDIPECLKDASDCVEILCQEEDRLHIRSCLLHPDFPVLPGKQPEDYETGRLVAYLTGHANVQNTRLLDTKTFSKYRENFWKIMIACGPDENLKRIMEACWKTDLSILAEPVKDSRFSDSIWRGVYCAVLWRLSDWISRCATLDAAARRSWAGEGAVLEWLNVFYRAAVDYLPLYKLKERELVLNQAGIFCRAMNLQEDQVDGELRALAGVLYRKKHETELEEELVDRRVCLPRWEMYVMRDKNAANIINEAVQKLLSEKSLSLAEPQYQDACGRLLGWIGEHENEVKELFPSYCTEEDRMKLLTTRAAVQMNRKVKEFQTLLKDTGVESLEQLKKLIQDAETHSSEAKQELFYGEDQDVDFDAEEFDGDLSNEEFSQKLREIGQAGEQYFNQKLIDGFRQQGYDVIREEEHCCQLSAADGRTAEIYRPDSTDYHQAGWDIRVRTTQPEKEEQPAAERVDFYEVKTSTVRSQYRRYLRISNEQMVNAAALGEHYHLVKVICDPASLEAVEHRCYDNLLQYLGNRTLQNVEKGYLWKETRE